MKKQNNVKWQNCSSIKPFIISLILIITITLICQLSETKEKNERVHERIEKVADSLIESGGSVDASYQKAIEKVSFDFDLSEKEETKLMIEYLL